MVIYRLGVTWQLKEMLVVMFLPFRVISKSKAEWVEA